MNTSKIVFLSLGLIILGVSASIAAESPQLGIGYGRQFLDNKDLAQYEVFWRQPLSFQTTLGDNWNVTTAIELGMGLIDESGSDNSATAKFFIMPQVILSPLDMVDFIFGFGAGYMAGETEFTDHDLGGSFFLASKVGIQFSLGRRWGMECLYYHQSNAGIYDHNASLNMFQVGLAYSF